MNKACQGLFPGPKVSTAHSILPEVFSFPKNQAGFAHNTWQSLAHALWDCGQDSAGCLGLKHHQEAYGQLKDVNNCLVPKPALYTVPQEAG